MTVRNLAQMHRRQAERLGPRPALRFHRHGLFHDWAWDRYSTEARAVAAALVEVGVQPGERVGILAENSVDWLVADVGILSAAAVCVSPHAPLTARQVHYQFAHAGVVWAFVSTREQRDKLLGSRDELPDLRGIVVFDDSAATDAVQPWSAFRQRGRQALARLAPELARREEQLGLDDLATVMYTSGTTGDPKGVMLTHGNLVSNALACLELQKYQPGDVVLSWLPYTHIYARTIDHYLTIAGGAVLALSRGAELLVADLALVEPTHLASVPRFYEKVLAAVAAPDPAETRKRLKRIFGPRIDRMSSGGAPLPMPIAEAFLEAGLVLYQGYGLTETSPVISFNTREHNKMGTVGRALPGVEVRIADDGEVLTRGPHVMKGYWREPEATAAAIRDGWFHTGDLGKLDEGYLSITGRKKELLVLSNGKKAVPSHLEGLLVADPCIDQAVVCGEGCNFLTALLVPNWATLRAALQAEGTVVEGEAEGLVRHPAVMGLLERKVKAALTHEAPHEQVKKFVVLPRPFTVEADELTVSLKLRRNIVVGKYAEVLRKLYAEGGDAGCG